jgi:hypothetical protein
MNRVPTSANDNISPYEKLYGRKPYISHIKTFGCLCYVKIPDELRRKFDYKCTKGIFLGYCPNKKAYYIFNEDFKIITSRDVHFEESTPGADHFDLRGELDFNEDAHIDSDYTPEEDTFSSKDECLHDDETPSSSRASFEYLTRFELESLGDSNAILDDPNAEDLKVGDIDVNVKSGISPGDVHVVYTDTHITSGATFSESVRKSNRKRQKPREYLALMTNEKLQDPLTYKEAVNSPNATEWQKAMEAEINSLNENNTWILVPKPKDRKIISSKWAYKTKYNIDGTIERYKARLVAKGFTQCKDIDYHETFAPVLRRASFRILLAYSAYHRLDLYQIDITTAFLYADLKEEIYLKQPEGINVPGKENHVYKLLKSLYGLKQAPREWNMELQNFLTLHNFKP